ncbi:MAG TPA: S41 family peptidase [Candidatus Acidoferrum sp.]|nr:S41 family peptidase [Candidatus Acidoferrum sp.]
MSEKIYALLLCLYPSHFREGYGDSALQLLRDRARDEKGFFPKLRLWLDVLADLAISLPREYSNAHSALIAASAQQRLEGAPSFFVLEGEAPRPGALLLGGVLSLTALAAFPVLLSQVHHQARSASTSDGQQQGRFASPQQQTPQSNPEDAASQAARATTGEGNLDAAERQRVIEAAVADLKQYYMDRDAAQKMADALLAHRKRGDDDAATDGKALADLLTKQMRDVSHDMQLELAYIPEPMPASRFDALGRPLEPTPEDQARYRSAMEQSNCTFEKIETLPHNIGYLKLNSFPDLSLCQPTAAAAMASLNHADAIIFDLRDNRGGQPEMVSFMAAYLFDHPEYWYNPRENTTQQSWTQSPVPGNELADKPVYVLTSARTFSGAEQFCYDLKMLKRATLIGETTGGAAHSGVWHRIDDHFGMGIPETKPVNPYAKADWEGTGVEPDVKVKAEEALKTAENLAQSKLQKK